MLFEDKPKIRIASEGHKIRHNLFGILVCTGMAHLVLTTFEVPNISYIRIFIVGAVFITLGVIQRYKDEKYVKPCAIAAALSMVSCFIEFAISGSHPLATSLVVFDLMTIALVTRYMNLSEEDKTDTLILPEHENETATPSILVNNDSTAL